MSENKETEGSSEVSPKKEPQKGSSRNQIQGKNDSLLEVKRQREKRYKTKKEIKQTTGERKRLQKRKISLVIKIIYTISALIPFFLICSVLEDPFLFEDYQMYFFLHGFVVSIGVFYYVFNFYDKRLSYKPFLIVAFAISAYILLNSLVLPFLASIFILLKLISINLIKLKPKHSWEELF